MLVKDNYYILTGGPGSGKTTLIEELAKRGYNCIPEVGRRIIKEQITNQGKALPWSDTTLFSELMLEDSIKDYLAHISSSEPRFFDRGIPDVLGYTELINIPNRDVYEKSVVKHRYNKKVFILPPWEAIYQTDSERKQNFQLAVTTYETMKTVYQKYDYTLIEVPFMSIIDRANFIIKIANEH